MPIPFSHRGTRAFFVRLCLLVLFLSVATVAAQAQLSITPSTWNVIGLDSNNVMDGPNVFPTGVRACNVGGVALTNVTGTLVWDSFNQYITLANSSTVTFPTLAAGACTEIFFNVQITRTTLAYNATRRFYITVSADNAAPVSTTTPREIYVEKLVSQNRNETRTLTGPSSVIVGQTYTYVMTGKTATGGYEQLVDFLTFSNSIFQIISIASVYTAPTGATNNQTYADACGWQNNPQLASYRSCVGPANYSGGKAGGDIQTTYTVKVIGAGTITLDSIIYDFSGSSYHYGSSVSPLSVTARMPPNISLVKSALPNATVLPGGDIVYTINFTNIGGTPATNFVITDQIPANTDFKIGSPTTSPGTTGLTAAVSYSNDGGTTWTYTPTSGAGGAPAGYDRALTHVRWSFTGNLTSASPNNTGSVAFTVRVR
ncbi:MAG TPA: hypothetical protein VF666_21825 [Pyrinomonadaceae bacterium]